MAYRFDTSRLTFFGSVNFPGETPENGEDAGNVEHRQVAVLSKRDLSGLLTRRIQSRSSAGRFLNGLSKVKKG
jgi:hypothetical protein